MILGGPVEFDTSTILLFLVILISAPVAMLALAVVGVRSTWRAASGDRSAQPRVLVVAAIEAAILVSSQRFGSFLVPSVAALIWLQVVVFFVAAYERIWPDGERGSEPLHP